MRQKQMRTAAIAAAARFAGIQTGGSERAFNVYMKARYLASNIPATA